jgi:hypothetical protein
LAAAICFAAATLPSTASAGDAIDWKKVIVESQVHLANAEPEMAEAGLDRLEREHPEIRSEPLFCYQRFFVALEGRGDRATAKLMLQRLDQLVDAGSLEADSPIYRSVTQAWHRALPFTDSDLRRRAHKIMSERLKRNAQSSQ